MSKIKKSDGKAGRVAFKTIRTRLSNRRELQFTRETHEGIAVCNCGSGSPVMRCTTDNPYCG